MNMVYLPPLPASTLPAVLDNLDTQLKANPTGKQYAFACVTASVVTVASSVFDVAYHTACIAVKALPTAFKVTVGKWTGLDARMSTTFDGKVWLTHAFKIYASAVLALDAITKGAWNPALVVTNGRTMGLMTSATVAASIAAKSA